MFVRIGFFAACGTGLAWAFGRRRLPLLAFALGWAQWRIVDSAQPGWRDAAFIETGVLVAIGLTRAWRAVARRRCGGLLARRRNKDVAGHSRIELRTSFLSHFHNMAFDTDSKFAHFVMGLIQGYNHKRYWSRRAKLLDPRYKNVLLKLYYLLYIKHVDGKFNCSFGTNYNSGARFATPPKLPHGPKGIIVGPDAIIGRNVVIYQHVTITRGGVNIGNKVLLGVGSVVLPGNKVGNNVKIGANAVVVEDIPDGATVVLQKPRIIYNNESTKGV